MMGWRWAVALGLVALSGASGPPRLLAQEVIPGTEGVELESLRALRLPPLEFDPPTPDSFTVEGVPVFLLADRSLPIVRLYARVRGGYGHLPRDQYGLGTALPLLLRSSGTEGIPADSVDVLMETLALETTFGTDGTSTTSTLDVLTRELANGLNLWLNLLTRPRFDSAAVERWRQREVDSVLRFRDDPGRLAVSRFNRLMYGDHSIGWEMEPADLTPERINPQALLALHRRLFCREHLVLGAAGDLDREVAEALLGQLVRAFPPCPEPLAAPPVPTLRDVPGTFLIPRASEQSILIMAHRSSVRRDTTASYFAAQIANSILGASGFSSRLLSRVRTEEGLAYGASSFWTTPTRYPGIVGATTRTGAAQTVEALELLKEILEEVKTTPPTHEEVRTAVDQTANGFVFNFQTPGQIVARQMVYRAQGLPPDWLQTYLKGIQRVEPEAVARILAQEIRPEDMVILIVGDPERFPGGLAALGDVVIWPESEPIPPGER